MKHVLVPVEKIVSESNRRAGGEGDIRLLAEDLKANGMISPVTLIRREGEDVYDVAAGRRRVAAARLLEWPDVPAIVRSLGELDGQDRADQIALSENLHRLPMHPLDEAELFYRIAEGGESVESIARRFDYKVSDIYQRIKLRDLSDGIKTMFREGIISLAAAAMAASLDDELQAAFFAKYGRFQEKQDDWQVSYFLNHTGKFPLKAFILEGKCGKCKTRTRIAGSSMFPELDINNDVCLDPECYRRRYLALILEKIGEIREAHPEYRGECVICSGNADVRKIIGSQVEAAGYGGAGEAVYPVKPWQYENQADEKDKGAIPAFLIAETHDTLAVTPEYWKEVRKKEPVSEFAPAIKLLGLPKKEAAEVREAAVQKFKGRSYEFSSKIRAAVLKKLVSFRILNGPEPGDRDYYFKKAVFQSYRKKDKYLLDLYRDCFGQDYDDDLTGMSLSDPARIFMFLAASSISTYDLPDEEGLLKGKTEGLAWFNAPPETVKEMYREAIRGLLSGGKKDAKKAGKGKGREK
jgi:ParB/RepB/Spo0J family partition protein